MSAGWLKWYLDELMKWGRDFEVDGYIVLRYNTKSYLTYP